LEQEPILTEDEQLRRLLRRCGHVLYHQSHHSQQDVVLALLRQGPMTQKQIQEQLSIKAGSVSELISKLEARQLLVRARDEADRRRVVLTLTEKGQLASLIHKERATQDLFTAFSSEEKEQLSALLEKLLESWGF
jgi:DNA-binding MarR family transcriptional regulator